jgi:hypothetical protein
MKHVKGDIWPYYMETGHVVCITTNGFVKKNGDAVMGRGNALEATRQIPGVASTLGSRIRKEGNVAGLMRTTADEWGVFVFPVKHNWWETADLVLIAQSTQTLKEYAIGASDHIFHLPRPGIGNGKLDWDREVLPLLQVYDLPDNVWVHYKG